MKEGISVLVPHEGVLVWTLLADYENLKWKVEVNGGDGALWVGEGDDLFDAFRAARTEPERHGVRFLVVGARVDCWPTRMGSQMGGMKIAVHRRPGVQMMIYNIISFFFPKINYRYIFSSASLSKVGTVAEQDAYRRAWLRRSL
ncbi:hypothetical protein [Actinomadura meyerae]|uniref:hypothetical protein n=1 Tax=Actinomadura meyerae TaxID=240840 RepID=UPI00117741DD|nr:hypothetical protein [Actinomadura meyerae]